MGLEIPPYLSIDVAKPTLRSTKNPALAVVLEPPGGGESSNWEGYRLGASHDDIIVLRISADHLWLATVDLARKIVAATRSISKSEMEFVAAAVSPTGDEVYLSMATAAPTDGGGLAGPPGWILALDGKALTERRRIPWSSPASLYRAKPALTVSGDGSTLVAYALGQLQTVDMHAKGTSTMVRFPGVDPVKLTPVPGKNAAVALRLFLAKGHSEEYAVEAISFPDGQVTRLRAQQPAKERQAVPRGVAVIGTQVFIAPGSPPRWANDPSGWDPDLHALQR